MGYYTNYTLEQVKNNIDPETQEKYDKFIKEYQDGIFEYVLEESTKWYEHDDDMCNLSSAFPKVVFRLHGDGEEPGDIWEKYYHGGKLIKEVRLNKSLPIPDLSKY
jgi:hypothetical protein